ncbi:prevent-host-death protein [Chryseobacterium sp. 09-1422]|jgi:hypothetical protein|uniref:Prevent-host-death protein n=1 Tax=Chryseobacterium kimseyorum TaxID=2984028 RepID=A0ABT3HT13_9FLAO|nr:prevent-host-death protein [Chryseobacterium kimseyorum]MCW3166938.1 prevent-host-death protein [Chryseobacterium kimseyorum]
MNYKLELKTQEPHSKIVFNNILFDHFKVNIVERYRGKMNFNAKLIEVLFKVRTIDNDFIKRRDGHLKVKIKGDDFQAYQTLMNTLDSYEYKNKLLNRQDAEQNYVHFILGLVISNYQLN